MLNNSEQNEANELHDENSFSYQENKKQTITKGQKISVIFLAFFAFLAIVLWVIQFKNNLSFSTHQQSAIGQSGAGLSADQTNETRLKAQDTDGDGLSDWDELYVYGTSPYLEDTDGDGISDYDEIRTGADPLCPANTNCDNSPLSDSTGNNPLTTGVNPETGGIMEQLDSLSSQLSVEGDSEEELRALEAILSGQSDAANLRKLLLDSGMDENILKQISDEELMETYQNILTE